MVVSRICGVSLVLFLVVGLTASSARALHTDQFDRAPLNPAWTFRAPDGGRTEFHDGRLHVLAPSGLRINPHEDKIAPILLMEPPADEAFSFETGFKWIVSEGRAPAGLVAIRKDLTTSMVLYYSAQPWGVIRLYWWDGLEGRPGGAVSPLPLGQDWEDIRLRVEMVGRGDGFYPKFFYKRGGDDDPWTRATGGGRPFFRPEDITPRFDPGEYWIGLFMGTPLWAAKDAEAAFDYFHSPEMLPLAVQAGDTTTTTWGAIRQR